MVVGGTFGARCGFEGIGNVFLELDGVLENELWVIPRVLASHMLGSRRHKMQLDTMGSVERVMGPSTPERG